MPYSFEGCWQRVKRADARRNALAEVWNGLIGEDAYSSIVDVDDNGAGRIFIKPPYDGLPESLALDLGEFLYQLRAALDGCIYQAAIWKTGQNPPPNEKDLEFPIYYSPGAFANNAGRKLGPLTDEHREIVEAVQPYNAPDLAPEDWVYNYNRALGILNDWARKDRHRKLHVVGSWTANASPMLIIPQGVNVVNFVVGSGGFFEDNSQVVATFQLIGYQRTMQINANPNLTIDVAVNELPPPCADNDTLGTRSLAMIKAVEYVIGSFQLSFDRNR
jgi:hypothetical protein